jgi:hypothetical protein
MSPHPLQDALAVLKQHPDRPVLAEVDGLLLEISIKRRLSADDVFASVGPWEGETADELMTRIREARDEGGSKDGAEL